MGKGLDEPHRHDFQQRPPPRGSNGGVQVPVAIYTCPTRHKLQVFPYTHGAAFVNIPDPYPLVGRCDYAANAGSMYSNVQPGDPNTGYSPSFDWSTVAGTVNSTSEIATGVIYRASECTSAMVKDGMSNVYMIGERYLCPDCYFVGSCCDNDQGWDQGYDYDTVRGTGYDYPNFASLSSATTNPPSQDRWGVGGCMTNFGTAHEAGFNMVFCDGVVRLMSFNIDPFYTCNLVTAAMASRRVLDRDSVSRLPWSFSTCALGATSRFFGVCWAAWPPVRLRKPRWGGRVPRPARCRGASKAMVPAKYNTQTTLGAEVASDSEGQNGGYRFDLKY